MMFENVLQTSLLCEPVVGEDGGIPAGCQCDKEGNIYVADMRLGILKVSPTGDFKQVCTKSPVSQCDHLSFELLQINHILKLDYIFCSNHFF